jgi:hypothetical protein
MKNVFLPSPRAKTVGLRTKNQQQAATDFSYLHATFHVRVGDGRL